VSYNENKGHDRHSSKLTQNCIIIDLTQGNELGELDNDHSAHNIIDLETEMQNRIEEELCIKEGNQCLVDEQIIIEAENQCCMEQMHQEEVQMQADHQLLIEHEQREKESKLNTLLEFAMLQTK